MSNITAGDRVTHKQHGLGLVASTSPSGIFAVVRYPSERHPDGYARTHHVSALTKVEPKEGTRWHAEATGEAPNPATVMRNRNKRLSEEQRAEAQRRQEALNAPHIATVTRLAYTSKGA